ncbi:BREX-1 system adenine-specific DNA-methyltransferase PglX [Kaistella sp.]|uniref:BREX-1 system adenine-specific DNA-methyltransferase PglX n=1 Tax=Kaistella sp. TaxID=2782235 RepID=UPI00359F8CDA
MNTSQIKKFAQEARTKLLNLVAGKLESVLTQDSASLRAKAETIKKLDEEIKEIGKEALIDKVAYTWFNRFVALRFMDANDFQPLGINILSPTHGLTSGSPQILADVQAGIFPENLKLDRNYINDILNGVTASSNPDNDIYRHILIAVCNDLHRIFPFLFEKIDDYTELLLPDDLTTPFSIVNDVVKGMTIENCAEVEIIGWIYQFYISEKKDEVFAAKTSVKKEDIPAATQLFTPRWIVEYMVQNTVGKLWLQNKPQSALREHMPYFIESPSVKNEDFLKLNSIEELTLLDQACGSGHILVYGFELLYKIYEEEGYSPAEIPALIITKNLHGFEIDDRAAQLAILALMMKARSYQRRFFNKEIKPNVLCYDDVVFNQEELTSVLVLTKLDKSTELQYDLKILEQATNYGSLMIPKSSETFLNEALEKVKSALQKADLFQQELLEKLKLALLQLLPLSKKYHCIVDNPPYMGGGNMNKVLGDFVKSNYKDSKADLMTCFMEAGWKMLLPNGYLGMINLPSWLFLSSFEKLRNIIIKQKHIDSLLHMGRGIFGVDWGSTAFIIQNQKSDREGKYFKLHKRNFQHIYPEDIRDIFLKSKNNSLTKINFDKYRDEGEIVHIDDLEDENGLQISYNGNQKDFEKIPGSPIGYWLSEKMLMNFSEKLVNTFAEAKTGITSGKNERFVRIWFEIDKIKINTKESYNDEKYWTSYRKGGSTQKWFGNNSLFINWQNDGDEIKNFKTSIIRNQQYFFKNCITWSLTSSNGNSFRKCESGGVFDVNGMSLFIKCLDDQNYFLGFLNSKITYELLKVINPTLATQPGNVESLPIIIQNNTEISQIVENNIFISKQEWNSRETSWDFQKNELVRFKGVDVESAYNSYKDYWQLQFFTLHKNEEELNHQFIEIYGLQEELTPEVPLEDITILKEESKIENGKLIFQQKEIMAQFISYAVGCMFGRYSLDKEGLILANQGETLEDYFQKVGKEEKELRFLPDADNVVPILEEEWFDDDIVNRVRIFIRSIWGNEVYSKNIQFVEDCLGDDLRKYFTKYFYADHIKRYKKRPIYWLFSSPKGHFNVLVYMHRYTQDTLNFILNSYLRPFREKVKNDMQQQEDIIITGSAIEQGKARKRQDKLKDILKDCDAYEYDILYPLAGERIAIDLDDGVLVNYNKFGKAIAPVPGLNDTKTKEKVRKFDWIDIANIK